MESNAASLKFSAGEGEDVAVFLQSVQQEAFAQRRQRDDVWIADYAATLLKGPRALKWYYKLDDEVQGSWKKLRVAMMSRFAKGVGEEDEEEEEGRRIVPTSVLSRVGEEGEGESWESPPPGYSNQSPTSPMASGSRRPVTAGARLGGGGGVPRATRSAITSTMYSTSTTASNSNSSGSGRSASSRSTSGYSYPYPITASADSFSIRPLPPPPPSSASMRTTTSSQHSSVPSGRRMIPDASEIESMMNQRSRAASLDRVGEWSDMDQNAHGNMRQGSTTTFGHGRTSEYTEAYIQRQQQQQQGSSRSPPGSRSRSSGSNTPPMRSLSEREGAMLSDRMFASFVSP